MTVWQKLLILSAVFLLPAAGQPVLVPDISKREIEIVYSFTGAELLLFGAITYPNGRAPTDRADIVVVLRGPSEAVTVRQKKKLAGLVWANASSAQFRSAPGFYAIASSRPLSELLDERTAAIYELGLDNLHLSPADGQTPDVQRKFESGFVDMQKRLELYAQGADRVEIRAGALYRVRLSVPARVPVGTYTAETFLISGGKVLAAATRDIEIRKSGFERFVAESAVEWPLTYGITTIALSLLLGWGAATAFRRI